MPRIHVPLPLAHGLELPLPPGAARHVQVLRLQPGHAITLFDGLGGEWDATVLRMGRSSVEVRVGTHHALEREAARRVHLGVGVMAAERMDWLVEKAAELGAASLTPLLAARCNLRLSGERAEKKRTHWQAVAVAACEQCGRNRLLNIGGQQPLSGWLDLAVHRPLGAPDGAAPAATMASAPGTRWLLSLAPDATPLAALAPTLPAGAPVTLLSGPEGGLSPDEETAVRQAGFAPVSLGPRVLRAETAPLAALALLLAG